MGVLVIVGGLVYGIFNFWSFEFFREFFKVVDKELLKLMM